MTAKLDLQNEQSEQKSSRLNSLRFQRRKDQPEIPAYLKAITGAQEKEALSDNGVKPLPHVSRETVSKTGKGEITITMDRSSIFAVFMGAAFLAITSFIAGLITYSFLFTGKPEIDNSIETTEVAQAPPASPVKSNSQDEGLALSNEAITFADQFGTPAAEQILDSTGVTEVSEDISQAGEQVDMAKEAIPASPEIEALTASTTTAAQGAETAKEGPTSALSQENSEASNQTASPATKEDSAPEVPEVGYYTVNLGEASTEQQANSMVEELSKLGVTTFISSIKAKDGRETYRLRQGKFTTYDEARTLLINLPKPYSVWGKVEKDQTLTLQNKK